MPQLYRITIAPSSSLEKAWQTLEEKSIEILYGSEDEGEIELFAHLASPDLITPFPWVIECEPCQLPPIDWEAQWAAHGHDFHDGYVHVPLKLFGKSEEILRLHPGEGFGDLSHPTTRLMMQIMGEQLKHDIVIDIGCGSGILSLAAAAIGAKHVHGIDIDPHAIEHSRQNGLLNQLEKKCSFSLPSEWRWKTHLSPVLILMNMIWSEQVEAWNSVPFLHSQAATLITSGIRTEERSLYLQKGADLGWSLQNEREEEGWLAFHFELNR